MAKKTSRRRFTPEGHLEQMLQVCVTERQDLAQAFVRIWFPSAQLSGPLVPAAKDTAADVPKAGRCDLQFGVPPAGDGVPERMHVEVKRAKGSRRFEDQQLPRYLVDLQQVCGSRQQGALVVVGKNVSRSLVTSLEGYRPRDRRAGFAQATGIEGVAPTWPEVAESLAPLLPDDAAAALRAAIEGAWVRAVSAADAKTVLAAWQSSRFAMPGAMYSVGSIAPFWSAYDRWQEAKAAMKVALRPGLQAYLSARGGHVEIGFARSRAREAVREDHRDAGDPGGTCFCAGPVVTLIWRGVPRPKGFRAPESRPHEWQLHWRHVGGALKATLPAEPFVREFLKSGQPAMPVEVVPMLDALLSAVRS